MSNVKSTKVNPSDVIDVKIVEDVPQVVQDPAPGRDVVPSVDVDTNVQLSLSPFELISQKLYDAAREAYNLDPTGQLRAVAVVVSDDQGKTWVVKADSTDGQVYKDQEQWSKVYVESEVAKTKEAYSKPVSQKSSPV